jgi:hypothetical protein
MKKVLSVELEAVASRGFSKTAIHRPKLHVTPFFLMNRVLKIADEKLQFLRTVK